MADAQSIHHAGNFKDLTGLRFGMLVVLGFAGRASHSADTWRCQCDCGNDSIKRGVNLIHGGTRSCGCGQHRGRVATYTSERKIWYGIKQRCYNANEICFARYGGRGIVMCEAWKGSFNSFIADMGPRPSPRHSIDRIDNDGPYAPWNCRWATRTEQGRNKRNNVILTHNGQSLTMSEWSEKLGIPENSIYYRKKLGWSDEKTLTTSVRRSPRRG